VLRLIITETTFQEFSCNRNFNSTITNRMKVLLWNWAPVIIICTILKLLRIICMTNHLKIKTKAAIFLMEDNWISKPPNMYLIPPQKLITLLTLIMQIRIFLNRMISLILHLKINSDKIFTILKLYYQFLRLLRWLKIHYLKISSPKDFQHMWQVHGGRTYFSRNNRNYYKLT
jgi:hypothetical protein